MRASRPLTVRSRPRWMASGPRRAKPTAIAGRCESSMRGTWVRRRAADERDRIVQREDPAQPDPRVDGVHVGAGFQHVRVPRDRPAARRPRRPRGRRHVRPSATSAPQGLPARAQLRVAAPSSTQPASEMQGRGVRAGSPEKRRPRGRAPPWPVPRSARITRRLPSGSRRRTGPRTPSRRRSSDVSTARMPWSPRRLSERSGNGSRSASIVRTAASTGPAGNGRNRQRVRGARRHGAEELAERERVRLGHVEGAAQIALQHAADRLAEVVDVHRLQRLAAAGEERHHVQALGMSPRSCWKSPCPPRPSTSPGRTISVRDRGRSSASSSPTCCARSSSGASGVGRDGRDEHAGRARRRGGTPSSRTRVPSSFTRRARAWIGLAGGPGGSASATSAPASADVVDRVGQVAVRRGRHSRGPRTAARDPAPAAAPSSRAPPGAGTARARGSRPPP